MVIDKNDIDVLLKEKDLPDEKLRLLLESDSFDEILFSYADKVRQSIYSKDVYIRGLIEFTNYCKNNCYYCGIRCENKNVERYRLSKDDILECCDEGYSLGFRTFVLQGGEDNHFSDDMMCLIIKSIKEKYSDCAVTISIGERSRESYQSFFDAGADRFLLRHETALEEHYNKLHPKNLSLENRKRCLFDLKEIGFQVGSGFMVGSPYQTTENLIADIRFLQELQPDMIGIGPFITHKDTPFASFRSGDFKLTLRLIAILRLIFPHALIPATTALGTIHPEGREMGLKAGANVVMPNLSPLRFRKLYSLYNDKICTGEEAAESIANLKTRVSATGYNIVTDIGHVKK